LDVSPPEGPTTSTTNHQTQGRERGRWASKDLTSTATLKKRQAKLSDITIAVSVPNDLTSNAIYLLSEVASDLAARTHVPEHAPTILEGAVITIAVPAGGAR